MTEELEETEKTAETEAEEEEVAAPRPLKPHGPRSLVFILLAAIAVVAIVLVVPRYPRAQHVRLHLGTGSSRVVAVTARIGRGGAWDRNTTWQFPNGAPPAIVWDFELANGHADVEVELATQGTSESKSMAIELGGKEVEVEISDVTRALP